MATKLNQNNFNRGNRILFPRREKVSKLLVSGFNSLIRNGGIGVIQGVHFNLQHDNLSLINWPPFSILDSCTYLPFEKIDGERPNQTSIWFYWFGADPFNQPAVRSVDASNTRLDQGAANANAASNDQRKIPPALKSPIYVNKGDTISICNVVDRQIIDNLQHPDDEIVKDVYIQITTADGSVTFVPKPFITENIRRMIGGDAMDVDAFLNVVLRIVDHFRLPDPSELHKVEPSDTNAYRAVIKAHELYEKLETMWNPSLDADGLIVENPDAADLKNTVKSAVALGYLWAYAEIDLKLRPLALARREQSRASSEGATKGAVTRQKKAQNEEWRQTLLPHAIEYCKKYHLLHPDKEGPSRSKLADDFISAWTGHEDDMGSHQSVVDEIKKLDESHKLQRLRQKNED
jgi:hypothetical protein